MLKTGEKVIHKTFGTGTITKIDAVYVTVTFPQKTATFEYPNVFAQNHLMSEDPAKNSRVLAFAAAQKVAMNKKMEEERKHREQEEVSRRRERITGKARQIKKPIPREAIAFKCNFCDGGSTPNRLGFCGVCSDKIINFNIKNKGRSWCSDYDSPCSKYYDKEINRKELEKYYFEYGSVCHESAMLRDWQPSAGMVLTGKRKGEPMRLDKVQTDSLCVLTTCFPNSINDSDRVVFAVFFVDEAFEGDGRDQGYVVAHPDYRIEMTPPEARKLHYWKYHANGNQPQKTLWGSGLHRYISNIVAAQILRDIISIKLGTNSETMSKMMFERFCRLHNIDAHTLPEPAGALTL